MSIFSAVKAVIGRKLSPSVWDNPKFCELIEWASHPWDGPLDITKAPPAFKMPPDMEYLKQELPELHAYFVRRQGVST